ncbi:MAG: tetratricopeptide repeat protein, partial [Bacteroidetes bacterium]|nr:tetratricopeptide repeat protein [Bacteroidota bacterium]
MTGLKQAPKHESRSHKGDKDKAIDCYQKVIDIKPDLHQAFHNMGNAYDDKG